MRTRVPRSLMDFKELTIKSLRANLDSNEYRNASHLKVQLIETNTTIPPVFPGYSNWEQLDDTIHWYCCHNPEGQFLILHKYSSRVWSIYSLMKVSSFNSVLDSWVKNSIDIDRCWLPLTYLQKFEKEEKWKERGIGIKYSDEFNDSENGSPVSIKAWYGRNDRLDQALNLLKEEFSVSSIRYKESESSIVSEWYSSGKITFNAGDDIEQVIDSVNGMLEKYGSELETVTKIRNSERGSFELNFSQKIDLDKFTETVQKGRSNLQLWMTETETYEDFRRFRGVDMHTWDRLFIDLGEKYAYLTVPGNGCVNAAPRMVTLHGETIGGKTKVLYNGNELFL